MQTLYKYNIIGFNIGWLEGHNVVYEIKSSQSSVMCGQSCSETRTTSWLLTVVIKASAKSKIKHAS